jgi:type II secretory ATPase GspE/PulE/Tfp pilus assembly ATPase PilB-like protein
MTPLNRLFRAGRRAAAATVLLAMASLPAAAQTVMVGDPTRGRYMSGFWLFMFLLYCVVWMGVFDWIGRDSEKIKLPSRFWGSIAMLVGFMGLVMMIVVSMGFVFTGIVGLIALFSVYVYKRNLLVGPEQRIFTKEHFSYVFRQISERFHLRRKAGAMMQARSSHEDTTVIELLRKDGTSLDKLTSTRSTGGTSEAVVAIKELVESAVLSRATDIHLEPKEGEFQARFRIDGILHNVPSYPPSLAPPMVSSVKVLSDMDIAEKRKPQDGSFMGRIGERTLDFRVATTPSIHGETMVIRILDRDLGLIRLEKLGMLPDHLEKMGRIIHAPHGMMIVSGPTGSGKTTTLYAMLSEIDAFQKNIITIEDPIEYRLDNVTQTAVNQRAGITFANALRSMLRQDPDVIMVGEIRDAETARVACQAAMTGHFVFTTLHANDSVTTLFRLLDLGVESYFIAASLSAVLAQRLLRVLCATCKVPYVPEPEFLKKIGVPPERQLTLYKAQGCEECQGTGYHGRIGVFELMDVSDTIKDLVRTNPGIEAITREAKRGGLRKLHDDGLAKVIKGVTSIKELIRVTR